MNIILGFFLGMLLTVMYVFDRLNGEGDLQIMNHKFKVHTIYEKR